VIEWLWCAPGVQPGPTHHIMLSILSAIHVEAVGRWWVLGRGCALGGCQATFEVSPSTQVLLLFLHGGHLQLCFYIVARTMKGLTLLDENLLANSF